MSTEVERYAPAPIAIAHERSIEELVAQADKIKQAMERAMEIGHHFGKIPGTPKPTLFKPGAEKLCLLFRLDPQYHSEPLPPDYGTGGHLTIKSVCTLWHIPTGQRFGSGEASCSTRESKYAFRKGKRVCPKCSADAINKSKFPPKGQPKAEPGWYCYAKVGGCGQEFAAMDPAIIEQSQGRVANEDLADNYNTVLKMANKRALVAAVLNVTAASDVFTQDLEDFAGKDDDEPSAPPAPAPRKAAPAPRPTDEAPPERPAPDDPREDEDSAARGVDEAQERQILLGRIKGVADTLKLDAKARAALWTEHVGGGDPREAPIEKLGDLYAALKARAA